MLDPVALCANIRPTATGTTLGSARGMLDSLVGIKNKGIGGQILRAIAKITLFFLHSRSADESPGVSDTFPYWADESDGAPKLPAS